MAKARQQYFADEVTLQKENRDFAIQPELVEKLESIEAWAQVNVIETVKVNWEALTPDENKAVDVSVPLVEDTLYSTDPDKALSANQWKVLYEYIQNLASRGRYLSNWNTVTWLPTTNPVDNPYQYRAWDYYVVSNVAAEGGTNYRPNGSTYSWGVASTTVETETVKVWDYYTYDWQHWLLLVNTAREIAIDSSLSTTSTNPVENKVITNALNTKQNNITDLETIRSWAALWATALQPWASLSELSWTSDNITQWTTNLFMTTAERSKLSNQSWVNTWDETQTTIKNKLWQASASTDGYLTSTDWNTFNNKQWAISDLETIRSNASAWKNASDTIATYGDVVTHDADEFATASQWAKADTALQNGDNVSELVNDAWYITDAYHDDTKQDKLIAWANIQIAADWKTISSTDTTYVAWDFDIKDLADSTWLRTEWSWKQDELIAWANIQIAADWKTISATDTKYTAWPGISISNNNVISNTQTSAEWWNIQGTLSNQTDLQLALDDKQDTLTAWANIQIAQDGTISATDTKYTAWTWISIDANNVISNTQTSAEWWNITWTLSDQTDLQTALDAKQDDLIAWANIQIAADWKTISATDTQYVASDFDIKDLADSTGKRASWDAKQNAISDLATIRSNASTAIQPNDNVSELTNDAGYITSADIPTLDTAMSDSSTNGVQNKVIKSYVDTQVQEATSGAVSDTAYWTSWNWITGIAPSKNAVYDKISAMDTTIAWKQATISDLSTIRAGAWKWATAVQPWDNVSTLTNDAGFITKAVSDLTNYYTKNETYTKSEVADYVANFAWFKVVAQLPTTDIKTTIIYLLWPVGTWADKYEEYIYSNNAWVKIWETSVDLTNYFNTSTDNSDSITQGSTNLFLTSAERTKLSNTSGTNTGDETKTTIQSKLGAATSSNDWYLSSADWSKFNSKADTTIINDTAYASSWNADTTHAPTKNAVYDKLNAMDTTISGKADATDVNVKYFKLSSTSDTTHAQEAVDWFLAWKIPVLQVGDNDFYYLDRNVPLESINNPTLTFSNQNYESYQYVIIDVSNWTVDSIRTAIQSFVATSWNQTVNWQKTFGTSPIVPSKTSDATNTWTAIATEAQVYKKQDKLATQTAYTSKGTASKVPQITTNSLWQVTWITEVDISYPSQVSDVAYASSWNWVTGTAPSKNAVYDKISAMDTTIAWKQNTLSTQTAYTSKWTSTKVPQITTNTLWQVTWITEVDIQAWETYNAWEWIEIWNDYSAMQWPAPDGFHVPLNTEWQAVYDVWTALGGWSSDWTNFWIALKLPFAGYRDASSAGVYSQGTDGNYWSSSRSDANRAYYLYLYSNAPDPQSFDYRAYGFSVRCFKNSPTVPTSSWTKLYWTSIESWWIFWSSTDWLISLSSDWQTWITIADKNLWATTVWNSWDTLSEANCGKYFQRWNNYGFPRTWSVTTSWTQVDASSYWPWNYYSSDTFIKYNWRWDTTDNWNLWWWVTWVVSNAITNTGVLSVNGETGAVNLTIPTISTITVTLTAAWWSSNEQTVSAIGVTASNTVIVSPAPSDIADYADCGVYCSAQGSGTLTFGCDTAPDGDIVVNVLIMS